MSDIENLCLSISTRPENNSIGDLIEILNENENLDYEPIFRLCGKYLSGINLDRCFELICKQNQTHSIKLYLESVEDISEKQLIQSLNYSFDYLLLILSKRYDYWSLTNAMKMYLNASRSVDLGEELVKYLIDFQQPIPSVLDWLCALIDAHFSSFVLAKWNKIPLIEKFVQDRLATFDFLQGLNTIKKSTSISSNKKTPPNNLYTLQRIHLK